MNPSGITIMSRDVAVVDFTVQVGMVRSNSRVQGGLIT